MQAEVLLLAEGSGGHLIPALETARVLLNRGFCVHLWYAERLHTQSILKDRDLPEGLHLEVFPTESRGWLVGLAQALRLARRAWDFLVQRKHVVVVGFGGRFSVPVVLCAHFRSTFKKGIHLVLHEQNKLMGRANRWLSRFVETVALSFQDTDGVPADVHIQHVGMPVRRWIPSTQDSFQTTGRFTLLVMGGSQGASSVNKRFVALLGQLSQGERKQWRIWHITGARDFDWVQKAYEDAGVEATVLPFSQDMETIFHEADVFVGRAGASSLAEAAQSGLPALLIPYPYANAHQIYNARHYESVGGAFVIREEQATSRVLLKTLRLLYQDRGLRKRMALAMQQAAQPDAAGKLSDLISHLGKVAETINDKGRTVEGQLVGSGQSATLQKACA